MRPPSPLTPVPSSTVSTSTNSPLSWIPDTTATNNSATTTTPQPLIELTDLAPKQTYDFFRRAYSEVQKEKLQGQPDKSIQTWNEFIAWRATQLHGFLHQPKYLLGAVFELLAWNIFSDRMFSRHASKFIVLLEAIRDILKDRDVRLYSFATCKRTFRPWKDAFLLLLHLLKRRRSSISDGDLKERAARLLIYISQDFVVGKVRNLCFGVPPAEFLDSPLDPAMEIFQFRFPEPEEWPLSRKSRSKSLDDNSPMKGASTCRRPPNENGVQKISNRQNAGARPADRNHPVKPTDDNPMPPPDALRRNPRPIFVERTSVSELCPEDEVWREYLLHKARSQLENFRRNCHGRASRDKNQGPQLQILSMNAQKEHRGLKRQRSSSRTRASDQISASTSSVDSQQPQSRAVKKQRTQGPLRIHKPAPLDSLKASRDYCLPTRHRRPHEGPLFDRLARIGWKHQANVSLPDTLLPTTAIIPNRGHTASHLNIPLKDRSFKFSDMSLPAGPVVTSTSITSTLIPSAANGTGVEALTLLRPLVQKFGIFCTKNYTTQRKAYQLPKPRISSGPIRG